MTGYQRPRKVFFSLIVANRRQQSKDLEESVFVIKVLLVHLLDAMTDKMVHPAIYLLLTI